MTAKEAFRLADSILRYEDALGYSGSFDFDDHRAIHDEIATVPDAILGAAYKCRLKNWNSHRWWEENRIMNMYTKKHLPRYKCVLIVEGEDDDR